MSFLKWYKYKIESNEIEPPESIWENIQDELDICQSWEKIDEYLDSRSAVKRNYIIAMAASFLVLLSVGTYWFLKPDIRQMKFRTLVENRIELEKNEMSDTKIIESKLLVNKEIQNQRNISEIDIKSKEKLEKTDNKDISIYELNENINKEQNLNKVLLAKLEYRNISIDDNLNDEIIIPGIEKFTREPKKDKTAFKRIYLGTTGQLANTWILNEKTYSGLESSSLITSNASFGSNFGLFLGTNISKRIDLQLDMNILAQSKQNYNEYLNGHYISNTTKLNYTQVALSLRYNFISRRYIKAEHGINIGSYIAYLHNATQIIDGETISSTSNYTRYDYGFFASYEYIIPISNKLGFGTGIKAYYGLKNIYSGDEFIPAYMNETNNASINISFSLKYSIR